MRTCLYLRISTDKSGDGLGIERQREDCRKLAEQRGWTVVQEIVENNTSATIGPRPGFESFCSSCKAGRLTRWSSGTLIACLGR